LLCTPLCAAALQVPLGSRVQLLQPDYDSAEQQEREELRRLMES
jgi:hypothetical protein